MYTIIQVSSRRAAVMMSLELPSSPELNAMLDGYEISSGVFPSRPFFQVVDTGPIPIRGRKIVLMAVPGGSAGICLREAHRMNSDGPVGP